MRGRFDENGVPAEANVRRILDIPEAYEVLCVISIGHPDEERKPYDTEKLQWEKVHIGQFKPEIPID
jgi:nitroreductase